MGAQGSGGDPVRKIIILLLLFFSCLAILSFCTGCKPPQPIVVPAPTPARIPRPVLRIKSVPPTITTDDLLRAYVLDLAEQVGYADQLETLIWGPKVP